MRAIPVVILAFSIAGATLACSAGAQTRDAPRPDAVPNASGATTGAAPTEPSRGQAPVGHRQPGTADVPNGGASGISPYDRDIDRNLQICRNC